MGVSTHYPIHPSPTAEGGLTILRHAYLLPILVHLIGDLLRGKNHQHSRVIQPVEVDVPLHVVVLAEEGREVLRGEPLCVTCSVHAHRRDILDDQHVLTVAKGCIVIHKVVIRIQPQWQRVGHVIE